MPINESHWLLRPTCSEGASVSGGGAPPKRTLDPEYLRSIFADAPHYLLREVKKIVEQLMREHGC
jgi:hypothetical protein